MEPFAAIPDNDYGDRDKKPPVPSNLKVVGIVQEIQ
jgi:hypothetical protein